LLLLPLLPTKQTASAKYRNNDHDHHHFYQAKALLFCFHGGSVPDEKLFATAKELFFGVTRRIVLGFHQVAKVLERCSQRRNSGKKNRRTNGTGYGRLSVVR
jgi:hypothetical protein